MLYYNMVVVWHKFTLYLIFSSNVCEYLRQCLCHYPETLLRDSKVDVSLWNIFIRFMFCISKVPFSHAARSGVQQILSDSKSAETEIRGIFSTRLVIHKWHWHEHGSKGEQFKSSLKSGDKILKLINLGLPWLPPGWYLCSFKQKFAQ